MWKFLEFRSAWLALREADLDESRALGLAARARRGAGRATSAAGDIGRRAVEARWSAYNPMLPKPGL